MNLYPLFCFLHANNKEKVTHHNKGFINSFQQKLDFQKLCWDQARLSSLVIKQVGCSSEEWCIVTLYPLRWAPDSAFINTFLRIKPSIIIIIIHRITDSRLQEYILSNCKLTTTCNLTILELSYKHWISNLTSVLPNEFPTQVNFCELIKRFL